METIHQLSAYTIESSKALNSLSANDQILVGIILGLIFCMFTNSTNSFDEALQHVNFSLVWCASVYVVFALVWNTNRLLLQLFGFVFYFYFHRFASKTPRFIVFGWLLHAIWDILHLPDNRFVSDASTFTPHWYPLLCIGFDVIVFIYFTVHLFI